MNKKGFSIGVACFCGASGIVDRQIDLQDLPLCDSAFVIIISRFSGLDCRRFWARYFAGLSVLIFWGASPCRDLPMGKFVDSTIHIELYGFATVALAVLFR